MGEQTEIAPLNFQSKEILVFLLSTLVIISIISSSIFFLGSEKVVNENTNSLFESGDPLLQGDEHDHRNASQHNLSSGNVELLDFEPLTNPGNAEIQVATSPDGRTYVYQAGWSEFHITDVTDPRNITQVGKYYDPNTQVLDVKYLEYDGKEYIITQNQLIDPGYADPNVGEWSDPMQVSVNLIDVTDKENPTHVDSWYDADHPSGPHNLYTHMIDNEWYIFVANPDYDDCDTAVGEACGGVTIAHLNLQGSAANLLPGVQSSGAGHTVIKVGEYEVNWDSTRGGWIYIHDMTVQLWPGDDPEDPRYGRTYIYGAYWEAGLRIADVSDVPHPQNSPEAYTLMATTCKAGLGNPVLCRWRAPEVGQWMEFADFDGNGEPDSGTTSNENGGRSSYIHYTEPFPEMVDASHLGYEGERHLTLAAVEVLSTNVGTGLIYLIDTTEYKMENGNLRFLPELIRDWEIPYADDHCYGADCVAHPSAEEWLLFSPHNLDSEYFVTDENTDTSHGGEWDGRLYISHYHAGLWVVDIETLMAAKDTDNRTDINFEATVAYYLPHGQDGVPLDSNYYDFGWTPFLWAAEWQDGITYASCITTGLYVMQLDIDIPYTNS
ncbi:MAG: Uncharacterised protein [Methanobacteriota archaeon]|nr:MAG: Uncharacterised protein [Euryarchaeota archaeon]